MTIFTCSFRTNLWIQEYLNSLTNTHRSCMTELFEHSRASSGVPKRLSASAERAKQREGQEKKKKQDAGEDQKKKREMRLKINVERWRGTTDGKERKAWESKERKMGAGRKSFAPGRWDGVADRLGVEITHTHSNTSCAHFPTHVDGHTLHYIGPFIY